MSSVTSHNKSFWAIVPAAGAGKRMQADRPKQYLDLLGHAVIEHSLQRLLDCELIQGVVVALDAQDQYWPTLGYAHTKPVLTVVGGAERNHSVLNALKHLKSYLGEQAIAHVWVLVHDAARPCVREQDLVKLMELASQQDDGGLLAVPVRDTMKRQGAGQRVANTVDRQGLWHALTPQMFKLPLLINAIESSIKVNHHITDDASAMELAGYHPLLVEGHEDNIKITRPFDLTLAALYMQHQRDNS